MADAFEQLEKIGEGAFGSVFKVQDPMNGKYYALKVLRDRQIKHSDVLKEVNVMSVLNHPRIIKFLGVLTYRGSAAIQMPFYEGGNLRQLIEEFKRKKEQVSKQLIKKWMRHLISALRYIHRKDILHRDLKPDNVLLDVEDNLVLADFGIAKVLTYKYTGTMCGTRDFIAPEVSEGRYEKPSDIYSYGCVFLCVVTLKRIPLTPTGRFCTINKDKSGYYGGPIIKLIDDCLEDDQRDRPTASEIYERLSHSC